MEERINQNGSLENTYLMQNMTIMEELRNKDIFVG